MDGYIRTTTEGTVSAFLVSVDGLIQILYNMDDLNHKCKTGVQQSSVLVNDYGSLGRDPSFFTTNLLLNFGLMYNSVREIVAYIMEAPAKSKSSFEAGR